MKRPEQDLHRERHLEAIDQDENLMERERKLNLLYEALDELKAASELVDEQGNEPATRT